ncbi:transporter [Variovorax rhizosphaerae]|uniref:Transporter n=1 Tax=Variovorax rhizosphaerae TaxID=1836200 RepID=A0ABU8WYC0_9BURK
MNARCRDFPLQVISGLAIGLCGIAAHATEGGLGRPVSGTTVQANGGIVPPAPIWAVNFSEIYLNGSIGGDRQVPVLRQTSIGIDAKISFTLATVLKVWDTGPGKWNFASSITLPYLYEKINANLTAGTRQGNAQDVASNMFDIYVSPIIAGYHFSETEHMSLSFNFWAPTGKYNADNLANPSLNNWTFIPQIAYTRIFPEGGWQLDAVAGLQFYTRNKDTDYENAPLFTLDVMGVKKFSNGVGAGLILGTVQQLGSDSGPTADRLNGFKGHDWAFGPVVSYDTKIGGKAPLSMSLRWVPTISSKNRIDSRKTVMATATLIF